MSENKNELEYISSDNGNVDTVAYGQTVDLELLNEKWVAEKEKALKNHYNGYLPLTDSAKEAKKFMNGLLADEARAAGADALVQGAAIKRQYNTMKRLSYWLSALGVMATTLAGYSVHKQVKQAEEYDTLLQQTVSALPVSHLQNARSVYANSIIQQMNKNPQMGVVEATETALSQVNSQSTTHMLPAVSRIVAQDVMALAEAYEDMGVPKQNYFNVMVGYSKDTSGVYAQRLSSPELVKDRVLYHLQNSYTR